MSKWPDDPTAYRPSARWVGIVVVAVMLGVFGLIGTWMWMSSHYHALVGELGGVWRGPGVTLELMDEVHVDRYGPSEVYERRTGDLTAEGTVDGRPVRGRVPIPRFPPWGSTVSATLAGGEWTLRVRDDGRTLVMTGPGARVLTLKKAE